MNNTEIYSSDLAAERIHALINSRPSSPSIAEMVAIIAEAQIETAEAAEWPANRLETEIRETVAQWRNALLIDDLSGDEILEKLETNARALSAQLPARATTIAEVVSRAELAWLWAEKEPDNTTLAMPDEAEEASAARLIVAVLQFAGLGRRYGLEGRS